MLPDDLQYTGHASTATSLAQMSAVLQLRETVLGRRGFFLFLVDPQIRYVNDPIKRSHTNNGFTQHPVSS